MATFRMVFVSFSLLSLFKIDFLVFKIIHKIRNLNRYSVINHRINRNTSFSMAICILFFLFATFGAYSQVSIDKDLGKIEVINSPADSLQNRILFLENIQIKGNKKLKKNYYQRNRFRNQC